MLDNEVPPSTLTVIILTGNEEANIAQALDSAAGWANKIFTLDPLITDGTLEIARQYGRRIEQNKFEDYAAQRNYAVNHRSVHRVMAERKQ